MFEKNAAYMERVNLQAGVRIYGDTDIETLATMVSAYFRYLELQDAEAKAQDFDTKQKCSIMKHKEAQLYERYLRTLKLDPGARVDFGLAPTETDDDEF